MPALGVGVGVGLGRWGVRGRVRVGTAYAVEQPVGEGVIDEARIEADQSGRREQRPA